MVKNKVCNNKERLKHALRKLRGLFDGIDEPLHVLDPATHEILFANKKLKELTGEKIVGKQCYKVFHNLNHPCPSCINQYIFEENLGKTYVWEHQSRRNKHWYRCVNKAIEWLGSKHVRLGMAIDITERKKMEEALKESEEKYRKQFEEALDAILVADAETGIIIDCNRAASKLVGREKSELVGKHQRILHPPEEIEGEFSRTFKQHLKEKEGQVLETQVITKKGEIKEVAIKANIFELKDKKLIQGIFRDITERKEAEEKIRESEEKYRNLFQNARDVILTFDLKGNVTSINRAVTEYGFKGNELIGKNMLKFVSRKYRLRLLKELAKIARGNPIEGEIEIITPKGKRNAEYRSNPIRRGKKVVGLQVILRDATERKRFEERLSALNKHGQSLNMADDIETVLTLTLGAMEKTLGFEFADVFLVEGKMLRLVGHRGFSKVLFLNLPLDGRRGVVVKAARLGKPVFVPDVRKERTYVKAGVEGMLSELAVPVKIGNRVLGVLNVESKRLAGFDEKDRELLETLASHTAIAISNLKRQEKLSALNIYGRSLNMAESLEGIHTVTLKAMEKTLGFEYASFMIIEGKVLRLAKYCGYPELLDFELPLDGQIGITVKAAKTGKPVYVPDVGKKKAYFEGGVKGMLSELAVPVKIGDKVLGVLNVESKRPAAFDEEDRELLEILASHAAIAISDLKRHKQLEEISKKLAKLMKSSTEIMRIEDMHQRLNVIAKAIRTFGWERVVISLRDEDLEGTTLVTAGLTKEEIKLLLERKAAGHVWRERLGPKFESFKIGGFYYLPWSDPWIREYVHGVPPEAPPEEATTYAGVPSRLSPEEMVDWHPQDMLYAPLRTPEGRIVGILSMDDPLDGRKPTRKSLTPLELFLHQAAMVIENAQLIESLRKARKQLEAYTEQLEQKVEERTRELKKSQEQLLKAQRLAVIGELAGMVGHDLRNPLTSISGAAYYLKRRLSPKIDGRVKEMLELIGKNIGYSNKIINDLLDYSREIRLDLTKISPKLIVREALSLVEIPKNVQVTDLTENKPKIKVDAGKMKRAFINMIKNAVEAMPKGGTLTIESKKLNGSLEFVFSDTGLGMSKKTMNKLWTPLFTTKAKGMGFGLPICKRIIDSHGGSISVKSARGKGTAFVITIPIKPKTEGGEKVWVKTLESSLLTTTRT